MLYDWINFLKKLTFKKIVNYLILKISYFLSVLSHKPVVFGYPAVATVEPTNLCNLRCIECPAGIGSMTRSKGNLDISLFRSFIDDLSPCLSYLMLYFQGEPLLHPQLTELIQYASHKKVYTSVSTNGHHLNRENVMRIIESGLAQFYEEGLDDRPDTPWSERDAESRDNAGNKLDMGFSQRYSDEPARSGEVSEEVRSVRRTEDDPPGDTVPRHPTLHSRYRSRITGRT